jgi:hypothetical protein
VAGGPKFCKRRADECLDHGAMCNRLDYIMSTERLPSLLDLRLLLSQRRAEA